MEVAPTAELLTIVSFPVEAPATVGAKVIGIANVWPGVSVFGSAVEAIEKPVPVKLRELIVTAVVPEELSVRERDFEVPFVIFPKLSEVALMVILGLATAAGTISQILRLF